MGNGEESLLNQIPNKAVFITFMTLFVIDRQMNSEREKSAIKTYFVNDFRHHNQNICLKREGNREGNKKIKNTLNNTKYVYLEKKCRFFYRQRYFRMSLCLLPISQIYHTRKIQKTKKI